MQLRTQNSLHAIRKAKQLSLAVRVLLILVLLLPPKFAEAVSMSQAMGLSSFRNLVLVIAMVNKAMRDAAENPMDEWRRQNVRHAISLMPAAIVALAGDFKSGKLHDKDLPFVQQVLGGFIDVNAADNYKKFLNSPNKSLIPKTGSNFPKVEAPALPNGPAGKAAPTYSYAFDDSAKQKPQAPIGVSELAKGLKPDQEQIAVLSNGPSAKPESLGNQKTYSIGFDENAKKLPDSSGSVASEIGRSLASQASQEARANAAAAASNGASSGSVAVAPRPSVMDEASRELNTIESRISSANGSSPAGLLIRKADKKEEKEDDFFAAPKSKDTNAERNRRQIQRQGRRPEDFKMSVKPKYSSGYGNMIMAMAAMGAMGGRNAKAQGGECQDCGGGGGGGGGQAAAQILMGVAAIISAIAPMVIASTQAKADITIAKINADTQRDLTKITSDTSKYLANQQKDIALTQTAVAQQISAQNNQGVTQRLDMQLAELRSAREDARQAEREKRALEDKYNQARIDLANKQADENLKLAKATLNAQLTQAGLSSGFSTASTSAGDRLTVGKTLATRTTTTGVGSASSGGLSAGGAGGGAGSIAGAGGGAGAGTSGLGVTTGKPLSNSTSTGTTVAANGEAGGSTRLISSLTTKDKGSDKGFFSSTEEEEEVVVNGKRVVRKARGVRASGSRGLRSIRRGFRTGEQPALGRDLADTMLRSIARGSSPTKRMVIGSFADDSKASTSKSTDLKTLINKTSGDGNFAAFRARENVQDDGRGIRTVSPGYQEGSSSSSSSEEKSNSTGHGGFDFSSMGLPLPGGLGGE